MAWSSDEDEFPVSKVGNRGDLFPVQPSPSLSTCKSSRRPLISTQTGDTDIDLLSSNPTQRENSKEQSKTGRVPNFENKLTVTGDKGKEKKKDAGSFMKLWAAPIAKEKDLSSFGSDSESEGEVNVRNKNENIKHESEEICDPLETGKVSIENEDTPIDYEDEDDNYPRINRNRFKPNKEYENDLFLNPYENENRSQIILEDSSEETEDQKAEEKSNLSKFEPVLPGRIGKYLMKHQYDAVQWVWNRIAKGKGCLLNDDMGLGKTVTTCSFLNVLYGKSGRRREDQEKLRMRKHLIRESSASSLMRTTLVVVPASVVLQWMGEIDRWGCFDARRFTNDTYEREILLEDLLAGVVEILVVSYDLLRREKMLLNIEWEVVVLDEIHVIKNHRSSMNESVKNLKTLRRIGLTGTLYQNHLTELYHIMDAVRPGAFASHKEFKEYYIKPIERGRQKKANKDLVKRGEERSKELRHNMRGWIMQRKKSLLKDELPVKSVYDVFCLMSPLQISIYKRLLETPEALALTRQYEDCDCGRRDRKRGECCHKVIKDGLLWRHLHPKDEECPRCPNCLGFPLITKLKHIANHLELFKVESVSSPMSDEEKFIFEVIGPHINETKGISKISNSLDLGDSTHCGKLTVFKKLLEKWRMERKKIIVFSNSTSMLDILQCCFRRVSYPFNRLDGSMSKREKSRAVTEFTTSANSFAFLVSTKAGGTGLNLMVADIVVNFDPSWNPAHDLQSQDRAYRIGRERDVDVYRFFSSGSIEQQIYARQMYKIQMSNSSLEGISEKRYFDGIQGTREKGDLFGLKNLLLYNENGLPEELQKKSHMSSSESSTYSIIQNDQNEKIIENKDILDKDLDNMFGQRKVKKQGKDKTDVATKDKKSSLLEVDKQRDPNGTVERKRKTPPDPDSKQAKKGISTRKKIAKESGFREGKVSLDENIHEARDEKPEKAIKKKVLVNDISGASSSATIENQDLKILKEKAELTLNNSDVVGVSAAGHVNCSQALDGLLEDSDDENIQKLRLRSKAGKVAEKVPKRKRKRKPRLVLNKKK